MLTEVNIWRGWQQVFADDLRSKSNQTQEGNVFQGLAAWLQGQNTTMQDDRAASLLQKYFYTTETKETIQANLLHRRQEVQGHQVLYTKLDGSYGVGNSPEYSRFLRSVTTLRKICRYIVNDPNRGDCSLA